MMLISAFIVAFLSQCNVNGQETCSVPVVCTRDDGSSFTTWRPMNENPATQPPTQPIQSTQTTEATSSTSNPAPATMQQLRERIALLSEPGWFYGQNGYQYWISRPGVFVTRLNANQVCEAMDARIAVEGLRSNVTRDFIVNNILKRCGDIHAWWIGYQDAEQEDTFVWDDGQTFALGDGPDWSRNQPDNRNGADCAVVARYFEYKWDDVPCLGSTNGIICERYIGTN